MKMFWFFTSTTEIPWAFKLCGIFQAACDVFLGVQYMIYGNGESSAKSYLMAQYNGTSVRPALNRVASGRDIPTGRRTPVFNEKDIR